RGRGFVGEEHLEHVDEFGALDRVAADADSRRLAEALVGGLEHGFIGERARTGNDADRTLAEDRARHDADLAFFRRQDARAVRAEQSRLGAVRRALTRTMSMTGMPSVMQVMNGISASIASMIASAAPAGGT